jgi:hypothetical protein
MQNMIFVFILSSFKRRLSQSPVLKNCLTSNITVFPPLFSPRKRNFYDWIYRRPKDKNLLKGIMPFQKLHIGIFWILHWITFSGHIPQKKCFKRTISTTLLDWDYIRNGICLYGRPLKNKVRENS